MDMKIEQYMGQKEILLEILQLEKRIFSKADSWVGLFPRELRRQNTYLFYCVLKGLVVGYIVCTINCTQVQISKLAIRVNFRRQGIGRKLLIFAVRYAIETRKVLSAGLHVDTTNTAAIELYRQQGFQVDTEILDYYTMGRHAYRMICVLQEGSEARSKILCET
eukprot:TRINITY_DN24195_c0_g2_i1.p2 TRINITY_DN24195_c0_g2~~TRINITY_DN24195_c0_g2_i1.p2  ORF type:complete len:164 (-),score=2.57 TRINITY_DN24195_c0_g2_i1:521-1012(-)